MISIWGGQSRRERFSMLSIGMGQCARVGSQALAASALLVLVACSQASSPQQSATAPARAASPAPTVLGPVLMEQAALCGRSVGIAVRCNMVSDQNDFALLRYIALQGLRTRAAGAPDYSQVQTAFDVAALEMMNAVGDCKGAAPALTTLEQKIEGTIAHCSKP
jgi:hypothetical protein